jgi:hypothetical protein
MAILRYDPVKRSGIGQIYSPSLEGQLDLSFLGLLADDLDADDFKPILTYSPVAYATIFQRLVWVNAWVKVTAGAELYPFVGRPEPRFALGSYSFIRGYTAEEVEPGEFVYTPIATDPVELVYKTYALPPVWFQISYPSADKFNYAVLFEPPIENLDPLYLSTLREVTTEETSIPFLNVPTSQGILLNLNPGVVADFTMYYTWQNGRTVQFGTTTDVSFYPF